MILVGDSSDINVRWATDVSEVHIGNVSLIQLKDEFVDLFWVRANQQQSSGRRMPYG